MPMQFVKNIKEGCNVVQCVDKPKSPPPLPKRNSNISLIPDRQPALYIKCKFLRFQKLFYKDFKYIKYIGRTT